MLDGAPIQYSVSNFSNGKGVKIGDPNSLVPLGWHMYEITYTTNRQLGYFKDHDELYWNVTGNGWAFPIEKASAKVILPSGINTGQIQMDAYTGKQGERGKDFKNFILDDSKYPYFETTRTLAPKEGFSIVVGWPKGFVREPTQNEKIIRFFKDNISLIIAILGILLGITYYFIAWHWQGRDPRKGTIIPQYEPPQGLGAGDMRYLTRYGYDSKVFSSAILNLAVKGFISIKENKKIFKTYYTLTKISSTMAKPDAEEALLLTHLFVNGDTADVGDKYQKFIEITQNDLKKYLNKNIGVYFERNIWLWLLGLAIFLASVLAYVTSNADENTLYGVMFSLLSVVYMLIIAAFSKNFTLIKTFSWTSIRLVISTIINIVLFGFIAFSIVGISFSYIFTGELFWPIALIFVLPVFFIFIFYFLIRRPTVEGRRILDHIEGFKWFLEVTEKDRMSFHNPPDRTPELFEKFLPYALALGVEHKWAEQFSEVFKQMESQGMVYHPIWYIGTGFNPSNPAAFGDSFGSSLNHAIAASSSKPGSSSGFGGGGGSGGGGGGGGGGGW